MSLIELLTKIFKNFNFKFTIEIFENVFDVSSKTSIDIIFDVVKTIREIYERYIYISINH